MKFRALLALAFVSCGVSAQWRTHLDAPESYAGFAREVIKVGAYLAHGFSVEEYRQANGPGTFQRVMVAVPDGAERKGRLPAVVAPFYFPEAMLGFDPKSGKAESPLAPPNTNLTFYGAISYMADLARRGYIAVSADAYYLTYDPEGAPKDAWEKWGHVGRKLMKDQPNWSGIGKLTFDTRLLVDLLCADARVDTNRIGIIGHSLGGKMAFYAGCLDPRIKVIVASDFGIGWEQTNWQDVWYWGDRIKELCAKGIDNADLLSLSGGKPFCLIAGRYDDESSGAMMRRAKGYDGHAERLMFINHASGHRPPRSATEAGYTFLDRYLK